MDAPWLELALLLSLGLVATSVAGEAPWPGAEWPAAEPEAMGMARAKLEAARDYALKGGGSGTIARRGRVVLRWGDQKRRYDLKSTTKSFGTAAVGLALKDGKIKSLDDPARLYHPSLGQGRDANAPPSWIEGVTIRHLLTHTAGFAKPGGTARMLFEPGTKWAYSDSGPNWLAECVTLAYRRDLRDLLFDRVLGPLGVTPRDLTWRRNAYRPHKIEGIVRREFGSGIHANVDAMARFGYLYLRGGRWREDQLIPRDFVAACATVHEAVRGLPVVEEEEYGQASSHYGLLWWNNADGTLGDVPRDAFWSWGLYDSLIVVIPSLDIVVARAGKSFQGDRGGHYEKLAPFLGPIAQSVKDK
ncbi:MAG: serine hydrolase domain-containing protein [Candidatus Brocadiia bacterium]